MEGCLFETGRDDDARRWTLVITAGDNNGDSNPRKYLGLSQQLGTWVCPSTEGLVSCAGP